MSRLNAPLIGLGGQALAAALVTPALCIDLDIMTANLNLVAAKAKAAGKALRPHVKAHKCPSIAGRQIAAGAIGLSCATIGEVAVMARAGFDGLLLTSSFANPVAARRFAEITASVPNVMAAVDSLDGVAALAQAFSADKPLGILIDINVGQNRTGIDDIEVVRAVANAVRQATGLTLRGIQAYYGQLQGVASHADRKQAIEPLWEHITLVRDTLLQDGHAVDIISGSGTGTASIDLDGPFTELQTGSYVLMDKLYTRVDNGWPLGQALSIATRVVSTARPTRAVLDAGLKAMATDAGTTRALDPKYANLEHAFLGDEHSVLIGAPDAVPKLDEVLHLVPPHCDPTMNLYTELHVFSGGVLTDIWPIESSAYR
jgi:3-hydroxy-D-aspartate aldolase